MSDQNTKLVQVQILQQMVELDPALLAQYKGEAMNILREEARAKEEAKESLDEVLSTMAATFKLEKKLLKKWLKASFKEEVDAKLGEAKSFATLDNAIEEALA